MQEAGAHFYSVKLRMRGMPGQVTLTVRDQGGEDGESRLRADHLELTLAAGEPGLGGAH